MIRRLLATLMFCAALAGCIAPARGDAANYERALANVLVHEGGWSNLAHDPGGVTLNGVTQARYNEFRRAEGLPIQPLTRAMEHTDAWADPVRGERARIYRRYYADAIRFDALPRGLDYAVFDFAVNSGPARAGRVLHCALLAVEGNWTPSAMDACARVQKTWTISDDVLGAIGRVDVKRLIQTLNDHRLRWLRTLSTFQYFGNGWTRRVRSENTIALVMTTGARASGMGFLPAAGPAKAYDPDDATERTP